LQKGGFIVEIPYATQRRRCSSGLALLKPEGSPGSCKISPDIPLVFAFAALLFF
jgi:hypothetical protein